MRNNNPVIMESFTSRYRNPLILLAVVLAQMLGLAVQVRRPAGDPQGNHPLLIRYWVVSAFSPFERMFLFAGHGVGNAWNGYLDLRHVHTRNRQLQSELDRIRLEQAVLAEDAKQDIRLQKLFAFQQQYISRTVAAHIIGTSGTDLSRVLYLDQGSTSGIRSDMPVITPDGVVGKIRDVFPHTAQVLEINDPTSGLGVMLAQTRLRGILRGTTSGQIRIVNVMPDERFQPGEQVVTSGGDQVYPRGLPVGTVEKIVKDPDRNPYVAILVHPAVNLSRLDEVLVITKMTDTMPAEMERDIGASEQKAADVLSQRLPGAESAPAIGPDGKPTDTNVPTRPERPPTPLHPDRFSPGTTPDADSLTPDAAYKKRIYPAQPAQSTAGGTASPSQSSPSTVAKPATADKNPQNRP